MGYNLDSWLEAFSTGNYLRYAKRLSGNDTLANKTHQAGPYIPKEVLFEIFPDLENREIKNPDILFRIAVDSHDDHRTARAIWYNNRLTGGTRNETRITGFGGKDSALLDPESTGALVLFNFRKGFLPDETPCRIWVCRNPEEEELAEAHIGVVEPGKWVLHRLEGVIPQALEEEKEVWQNCWLHEEDIPAKWRTEFPSGMEIIRKAIALRPEFSGYAPDRRLMKRRECEFELFRCLEKTIELPKIRGAFTGIEPFLDLAQSILQRRKSRSGRSLELHLREIFLEEHLVEDTDFSFQAVTEINKKPDFIFPSSTRYHDNSFPPEKLRMLAVKTTCKDRWRQILNEADRIKEKHLLTIQEGISPNQFREMREHGVKLVVPEEVIRKYSNDIRPEIMTLEAFSAEVKALLS